VTRILQAWGFGDALRQVATFPLGLHARSMSTGEVLATLPIKDAVQLYGAPYVTIHRADLHGLLLHGRKPSDTGSFVLFIGILINIS
jgi:salicylate hydroxylase